MRTRTLSAQVVSFALVGGIGFIVDASILTLLSVYLGFNIYLSRAVSFSLASLTTWLLNRRHTFGQTEVDSLTAGSGEYLRYMSIQIAGALINFGVFSALIGAQPSLLRMPVLPLAIGSAIAMFFNFFGARFWIYRK